MVKSTTFSVQFLVSSLPPDTKIIRTRIYFSMNKTDTDDQYDLY